MSNHTPQAHRIQWLVKAGDELIPHTSSMRGTWAFEARCSCGWESRTGGAVRGEIKRQIADHKLDARIQEEQAQAQPATRYLPALSLSTQQPAPATRTVHLVKTRGSQDQALCGRLVEVTGPPLAGDTGCKLCLQAMMAELTPAELEQAQQIQRGR